MIMDFYVNLGIAAYFIGAFVSVMFPYLIAWLETGEKFNWRYIVSRLLGVLVVGLFAIVAPGFTDHLIELAGTYDYAALYFIAVMMTTFGSSQLGRETEKFGKAVIAKISGE
jgi:drug/metabolite transporter (DMT)-like permease